MFRASTLLAFVSCALLASAAPSAIQGNVHYAPDVIPAAFVPQGQAPMSHPLEFQLHLASADDAGREYSIQALSVHFLPLLTLTFLSLALTSPIH